MTVNNILLWLVNRDFLVVLSERSEVILKSELLWKETDEMVLKNKMMTV
jgi:hypothetical protein